MVELVLIARYDDEAPKVDHPDGISEQVLFCTGVWSPASVAAQAARAPMVRW